ncbi:hypothetical protein O181_088316 [Austropuccinia psidii MF-1]|uniref:Uncharacterized protein n=1 Tax=Austropuccinia psidii MF-1 TaxID=1389203 RepID=A0A9Q3P6U9_9BASI|nr:hypothetical protein [Austropuccinia psidii MF-1]
MVFGCHACALVFSHRLTQIDIIPRTPIGFQPTIATITTSLPPASAISSTARPALIPTVRPSPIIQSRNSPIVTSQQLQPVARSSRGREELSPLPFPSAQWFWQREFWPIQATGDNLNTESENQDAVAKLFRRIDRNSREVIEYANDRTIPGTASEEIVARISWEED